MRILWRFLKENRSQALAWLTGLMLLLQVMNLHSYVVQAVDHQAIVAAGDDDASWNLAKTVKTRWWKDNGWFLYGPFYFRVNHTIHYLWGRTAAIRGESPTQNWEQTAHHAIMTTSLLSLAALALLIASTMLTDWWTRFLLAFGLLAAFTSDATFAELVLRAHPDMLLCLCFAGAMWLTIRMLQKPGDSLWFYLSASVWGISMGVKAALPLMIPGFVILFVPPFKRERFLLGLKYAGAMFLAYFVVGFPQTIVLDRPFKLFAKVGTLNVPATLDSVGRWLVIYGHQLWAPVLLIFVFALFFSTRRFELDRKGTLRLTIFVVLPFLSLLTRNVLVPFEHYPLPIDAALLVFLAALVAPKIPTLWPGRFDLLRGGMVLAAILFVWGSTPHAMQVQLDRWMKCRTEARETLNEITKLYHEGLNVWVDPYVPYLTDAPKSRMEVSWEKTWSGFAAGDWAVLALNRGYVQRYASPHDPDPSTQADVPGWRPVREFYLAFINGDEAKTPTGVVFKRTYQNSCGMEIWRRQ
ncbi:MAG: hypothetical protein AB7F86_02500 [Bdellovibrionales bacterium]